MNGSLCVLYTKCVSASPHLTSSAYKDQDSQKTLFKMILVHMIKVSKISQKMQKCFENACESNENRILKAVYLEVEKVKCINMAKRSKMKNDKHTRMRNYCLMFHLNTKCSSRSHPKSVE